MSYLVIDNVEKYYGLTAALRGLSAEVPKGQWVNITGPSGSGKSTLLNIIGGLDSPSSGEVIIDSLKIHSLPEDELAVFRREKAGYIFQQSYLIPYLNALENVMLAQYFHSMADRKEAEEALKKVGLGQRLFHRPSQLSGGEQQRVCIARALINNPEVLFADEPTGNLDRDNTKVILDLLRELHSEEQFTILLVTHDPFVTNWGQRILSLEDGRIKKDELHA